MDDSTDPARSGEGSDDPTAPAWASPPPAPPTQPLPSGPPIAPPSPYAAPDTGRASDPRAPVDQPPYPQQPQDSPYGSIPYGPPGYVQQPYGSPAYGRPPYGLPPEPYGPPPGPYGPYGAPPARNTSAVVLTVLSGVATALCCLFGLPSLILGIVALNRQTSDPQGSARMSKYGWITFGVLMALALVVVVVLGVVGSADPSTSNDFDGL